MVSIRGSLLVLSGQYRLFDCFSVDLSQTHEKGVRLTAVYGLEGGGAAVADLAIEGGSRYNLRLRQAAVLP
jgi:hypothetical protein